MDVLQIRRRGFGALLAAGLLLALVAPAQAAGDVVDQSQTIATSSNTLPTPMAQTFTAGVTGQVDRVTLISTTFGSPADVTVQLQTVSAGKPSGIVLGSSSFAGAIACCQKWHDFPFKPAVPVTPGTQYAIVLVTTSGSFTWYDSFSSFDNYPAGQLWLASGSTWISGKSFGRDFCFETWVTSGAANRPPAVTVASGVVTANEGSPVTNSGTYSDPDGDSVALSASAGTLTRTGTSSGSWSWSAPPADESPLQTVTITASDGKGGTAAASFTLTIAGVPPTVSITGAPASGPEGTAIQLTSKATSPSATDTAFAMTWSVTKNGNPFATGSGASFTFTPDDEGTFVATLQAVDDGGNSATATANIAGGNVAPSVVIGGITHSTLVVVALQPLTFNAGFTDPGVLDTHTGTFDYGDGTPTDVTSYGAGGSGDITDSHAYAAPGTYTVTYSVSDDDGGTGIATATVTVETTAQALSAIDSYVKSMSSLNGGEKNGLSAKLRAAMASAARGDTNATCNQLDAVMNDLTALTNNGRLSPADSAALSSSVWAVHRALGCTKVKVGWLTLSL